MQTLKLFLGKELNIKDDKIIDKFRNYNKLILEWNSKINLVSRKTTSIESHILNSIFFLTKYSIPQNSRIIDIGTGGGFPGIPLKFLRNDLNITLLDSIQKKINAVTDITFKLGLKEIHSICGRAEDLAEKKEYSKKFDIVIAKSVSSLDNLYSWSIKLVKDKGKMIFIKGGDIKEEISALRNKYKNVNCEIIEFEFDDIYGIEDKKIVIIKIRR
jgi:16S rRNA (guanine527-N7)-methyltransferase